MSIGVSDHNRLCPPELPDTSWEDWGRRITDTMQENMSAAAEQYLAAYDYGHPYMVFLEAQLGFEFNLSDGSIRVPPFLDIMRRINLYIDGQILRGEISENTAIRPARLMELVDGSRVALLVFDPIPAGAKPVSGLSSTEEWLGFLAQGCAIISEPGFLQRNQSYPEHELVHLVNFLRFPQYAASISNGAREKCARGEIEYDERFKWKLYFVVELLNIVPQEKSDSLRAVLKIPLALSPSEITVSEMHTCYSALAESEIREIWADLDTWLLLHGDVLGGLYGSPVQPSVKGRYHVDDDRRLFLARLATLLMRQSELAPHEFTAQALREPLDPASKVFALFNHSGIFSGPHFEYWRTVFSR